LFCVVNEHHPSEKLRSKYYIHEQASIIAGWAEAVSIKRGKKATKKWGNFGKNRNSIDSGLFWGGIWWIYNIKIERCGIN